MSVQSFAYELGTFVTTTKDYLKGRYAGVKCHVIEIDTKEARGGYPYKCSTEDGAEFWASEEALILWEQHIPTKDVETMLRECGIMWEDVEELVAAKFSAMAKVLKLLGIDKNFEVTIEGQTHAGSDETEVTYTVELGWGNKSSADTLQVAFDEACRRHRFDETHKPKKITSR